MQVLDNVVKAAEKTSPMEMVDASKLDKVETLIQSDVEQGGTGTKAAKVHCLETVKVAKAGRVETEMELGLESTDKAKSH